MAGQIPSRSARALGRSLVATALVAAIVLAGCRSAAPLLAASLPGTSWAAADIDGRSVPAATPSTLTFESPRRVSGRAGCNQYFGALDLGEGTLRVTQVGATRMACAPAVMEQESRFLAALGEATAFRRDAEHLVLLDGTGRARIRLAPLARDGAAPRP